MEQLVAETGYERMHVVGHSLGGLIARYYVTRLGGDERVHTLVTLGTPHSGTYSAYALPSPAVPAAAAGQRADARAGRAGAGVPHAVRRLLVGPGPDGAPPAATPGWTTRTSPPATSRCTALGHMSLPISGRVVHGISTALAHLDPDGSTVTAGVTHLAAPAARAAVAGAPGGARRTS